jgi:hypothetical protein
VAAELSTSGKGTAVTVSGLRRTLVRLGLGAVSGMAAVHEMLWEVADAGEIKGDLLLAGHPVSGKPHEQKVVLRAPSLATVYLRASHAGQQSQGCAHRNEPRRIFALVEFLLFADTQEKQACCRSVYGCAACAQGPRMLPGGAKAAVLARYVGELQRVPVSVKRFLAEVDRTQRTFNFLQVRYQYYYQHAYSTCNHCVFCMGSV